MKYVSLTATVLILFAISNSTMAAERCEVLNHSYWTDFMHCSGENTYRCYADIRRADGTEARVWGDSCWASPIDCWGAGGGGLVDGCDGEE